ncbi:hypothetical protein EDD17DRAFT_1547320 [Pisolithus thermaeus]|nr:hypothetical protein EV401DRAFT_1956376 [Pisolithus croceorrhizus]KAI6166330.1 hypothetical protein EDD17DRAFT_1547320 [Pisolithus thermaeus]
MVTCNEEEFYLACAPIELRGFEALKLMHASMGETLGTMSPSVAPHLSLSSHRDGAHAHKPSNELQHAALQAGRILSSMRPWFCGQDSESRWRSEGTVECEGVGKPKVWRDRVQGRGH